MILSSYTRKDSPYVWIQFTGANGKKNYEKTRIRKDDPERERRVSIAMNKLEAKLLASEDNDGTGQIRETWNWVAPWLRGKYAAHRQAKTLKIYLIYWRWLSQFFAEHQIHSPGLLQRHDCFAYIDWRRGQVKEKSGRSPGLNTALAELKLLGMVMGEAIVRGYAVENPASKLGIEKEDSEETPAMSDAEIPVVFRELQRRPLWMQRSFFVAYHTGLRFATTQLHRSQVRWEREEIGIEKPKGGKKKEFAIPLYPSLVTLLREWWESGEARLWEVPAKERPMTGLAWTKFFREIGMPHLKFHSTRTTFITRGALGDAARGILPIPESVMMKLVNHARLEVHRIYQRFSSADLKPFSVRMALPALEQGRSSGDATPESRSRKTSRRTSAGPS